LNTNGGNEDDMKPVPNLDDHPLRYAGITNEIEKILFRRSLDKRLGGYTLETSLEIAEALVGTRKPVMED
jgi:hypothetical protein